MRAALCRVLRAEPHELSALAWAFTYFFLLLCSYYLLRPVRDALAVEAGAEKLQWLFTGTFAAMLALVPAFGWLCTRLSRARLLPVVYAFFALNLLLFSARLDAAVFFIWLSVFNLFVVSVFWSFMSDLFSPAPAAALYFAQVEIVRDAVPDAAERTRLFAGVDLAVNALTLLVQLFAFARLSTALGPAWMLALMPVLSLAGFLWLGAAPVLGVLIAFGVVRRIGEFSISKPARDALFTVVPREERYKAKNFIDTVIYRGGDTLSGWLLGGVPGLAFVAAAISAAWIALAFFLGGRMKTWTREDAPR